MIGIIRDMQGTHPDFERLCCGDTRDARGIDDRQRSKAGLRRDRTVFGTNNGPAKLMTEAEPSSISGTTSVDGVNSPFLIYFFFVPNGGVFTFDSSSFFPLDGMGWGSENRNHNFHFTTELHTRFRYRGGGTFQLHRRRRRLECSSTAKLAIDLGGVHAAENAEVNLDMQAQDFGIEVGKVYAFDLFQAERHTSASNFRVDTNLDFVNCGIIIPK